MKELLNNLMSIIGSADNTDLECDESFDKYWIHSEFYDTEFRVTIFNKTFIISRVMFQKRRNGTMSKCVEAIKEFHSNNKDLFNSLVIQSEETYEINQWSRKNGFVPVQHTCMEFKDQDGNDIICGDWKLELV